MQLKAEKDQIELRRATSGIRSDSNVSRPCSKEPPASNTEEYTRLRQTSRTDWMPCDQVARQAQDEAVEFTPRIESYTKQKD